MPTGYSRMQNKFNTIDPSSNEPSIRNIKPVFFNEKSEMGENSALKPGDRRLIESYETVPALSGAKTSAPIESPFNSSIDLTKGMNTISHNKIIG